MQRMAGSVCRLSVEIFLLTLYFFMYYAQAQTQAYVAYMGSSMGIAKGHLRSSHLKMLASTFGSVEVARKSLIYSYTHSINGFSAVLSKQQAQAIASMTGVISVFPSRMHKLHTTRSWDFLGLDEDYVEGSVQSRLHPPITSDVIIGLLDTGVWPELASFDDHGMGPIPSRWKGKCVSGELFNSSNCNRKLIGARYYDKGASLSERAKPYHLPIYEGPGEEILSNEIPRPIAEYASPRDSQGHGTHTATAAGGRAVAGASYYGLANGTARGGAPLSRIGSYKVCSEDGCSDADILAAFDNAIEDGVDVLSLSLGASSFVQPDLMNDGIAIGAFHGVQKGILVVCSAGNNGPYAYTAVNTAPWILTVAASTIDRSFDSKVVLGNNKTFEGQALNYFSLDKPSYPIVFGGDISAPEASNISAGRCTEESLDATKAKGKIVLCIQGTQDESRKSKSLSVQSAGGVGMIIADDTNKFLPSVYVLPATQVSKKDAAEILAYIRSTSEAVATILRAETKLNVKPSPVVAKFSSRGPNQISENILKPDLAAPGVNILAGWTGAKPYSDPPQGEKPSSYSIISGTSMACPHVSGAAAFMKSIYPDWSVSAIKSALMTTATTINNADKPITDDTGNIVTEFGLGTGEINPIQALNPGLVYKNDPKDHFSFLCYAGYNQTDIGSMAGNKSFVCPTDSRPERISSLNYPSIAVAKLNGSISIVRTLTNVGAEDSTYKATIVAPQGIEVKVSPQELVFSKDRKSIAVSVELKVINKPTPSRVSNYVFGRIVFSDGTHTVTTPIVVNPISI